MESIFNPFFTTKPTASAWGWRLFRKIVDEHGGTITVESEPGTAACFRVFLPFRESLRGER